MELHFSLGMLLFSFGLLVMSFGLFLLCIRAGLFLAADKFVDGVHIDGFMAALLGSLLTGGINWLIHRFVQLG